MHCASISIARQRVELACKLARLPTAEELTVRATRVAPPPQPATGERAREVRLRVELASKLGRAPTPAELENKAVFGRRMAWEVTHRKWDIDFSQIQSCHAPKRICYQNFKEAPRQRFPHSSC